MKHAIKYAGAIEYASVTAEWGRCSWPDTIRHAFDAATADAARWGDKMHELVSIDGRRVTTRENIEARKH